MGLVLKKIQEMETLKKISYISGNKNPKKASYIPGNKTFQPELKKTKKSALKKIPYTLGN